MVNNTKINKNGKNKKKIYELHLENWWEDDEKINLEWDVSIHKIKGL